jgi:hypothetical protein
MPEVLSIQTTAIAAGRKNLPGEGGGRMRTFFARYVQGASTQAIGDTIYLGDLPKGARLGRGGVLSLSTGTASCTLSIGLRTKGTGTVLSATAIGAAIDAATAGQKLLNNGAYIGSGEEYVTVAPVEVYATINTAVLAPNQKIVFEIPYIQD